MPVSDILAICQKIVLLLSQNEYKEIERMSDGRRVSAAELSQAVDEYGATLIPLPEEGKELVDVYEIAQSNPQRWGAVIPLWSQEEGRSDLTLELTLIDQGGNELMVQVDDLHVL